MYQGDFSINKFSFRTSNNIGKASCEPGWSWKKTLMEDFDIWYVIDGTGNITINNKCYSAQKGCCFVLHPGDQVHANQNLENRLLVIYIHFNIDSSENIFLLNDDYLPARCTFIEDTYRFESDLHRLLEMNERKDLWSENEFDILMKIVWLNLLRIKHNGNAELPISFKDLQRIHRITDYIRMHISNPISHEKLANLVELSPRYLSGIFKKQKGYSLKEFITRQRMDRAKVILTETNMTVSQVAEAVGYSDIYFFSKLFKRLHGFPPSYFQHVTRHAEKHR